MASTRTFNQVVNLTKSVVNQLPAPASGQTFYRDIKLKGFALRITTGGVKSFIVEKRIEGRVRRQTLGRYGELTVAQARTKAQSVLGQIAMGLNPIAERERERLELITLGQAFEDFKRARKSLKGKTLYEYELLLNGQFKDWKSKPLVKISKDKVAKRHREIGAKRGEASANGSMRFLRSLLNFAIAEYEDGFGRPLLYENPVKRLNQTRAWYRDIRRQTLIKAHQLPAWYKAVEALRDEQTPLADTVADYLLFLLFTGLRRREAAELTWNRVDLLDQTLCIPDPKNREPFTLPLSYFLVDLLTRRREVAKNAFVFPGEGRRGYLVEPKRQVQKVIRECHVNFTPHDLRRTFVTLAESIDIPPYCIKRLVNHKISNDVTSGYIVTDIERLRNPMQRITDAMLLRIHGVPAGAVVPIRKSAH